MDILKGLRQIVALGETGNYRKAAEQLGVTHSALSQSITKIEEACEATLFVRNKKETVPTAFGRLMLEAARTAISEVQRAERDIALMKNLEAGRLVIGADPNLSEALLAPALIDLMNAYPRLRIKVLARNWKSMESDLQSKEIDFYVGLAPDRRIQSISYQDLPLAPPVIVCRDGHPLLSRPGCSIRDVMEFPTLGGEAPDWFYVQIQKQYPDTFTDLEQMRQAFLTTHDLGLVREMTLKTDAVAMLSLKLVLPEVQSGRLKVIELERPPFSHPLTGVIARLNNYPLPPISGELINRIIGLVRSYSTQAPA